MFDFLCKFLGTKAAILDPKGVIAHQEKGLILSATYLMLLVVIPVFVLAIVFTLKYRESKKGKYTPNWAHSHLGEFLWWGIPLVIVGCLAYLTWNSTYQLNPYAPIHKEEKPLRVQAVALNWKWLFIYPEEGIATINFIQIPLHKEIQFEITADAPMNSFWIPQLGGQIYAMPGMKTELHLEAGEEGEFQGLSANFSGEGFSGMRFVAKATSEEEYLQWVSEVKRGEKLGDDRYESLRKPTKDDPVQYYQLGEEALFENILSRYKR